MPILSTNDMNKLEVHYKISLSLLFSRGFYTVSAKYEEFSFSFEQQERPDRDLTETYIRMFIQFVRGFKYKETQEQTEETENKEQENEKN